MTWWHLRRQFILKLVLVLLKWLDMIYTRAFAIKDDYLTSRTTTTPIWTKGHNRTPSIILVLKNLLRTSQNLLIDFFLLASIYFKRVLGWHILKNKSLAWSEFSLLSIVFRLLHSLLTYPLYFFAYTFHLLLKCNSFALLCQQGALCLLQLLNLQHATLLVQFNFLKQGVLDLLTLYVVDVRQNFI